MPTEHLNESDVSGYIDDDLPLADRRRVEAHLEACSECRATIVAVMRVAESFEPSVAAPRPMPARPHRRKRWTGVATVLAAAGLAGVLLVPPEKRSTGSHERSARELSADGRQVIEPIAPTENDTVTAARPMLRWHAAAVDLYRVVLMDDAGAPRWMVDTRDTVAVVTDTTAIVHGKTYWWRVDGITDGLVATSGAHRFIAK